MFLILLETSKALKKLVKQQTTEQRLQVKKKKRQNNQWLKMIHEILEQILTSAALDMSAVFRLFSNSVLGPQQSWLHHTVMTI